MILLIYSAVVFLILAYFEADVWWIFIPSIVLSAVFIVIADCKYDQLKERIRELERNNRKGGAE